MPAEHVSPVVHSEWSEHEPPFGIGLHDEGVPVHVKHGSTRQDLSHPSPSIVLPSSHSQRVANVRNFELDPCMLKRPSKWPSPVTNLAFSEQFEPPQISVRSSVDPTNVPANVAGMPPFSGIELRVNETAPPTSETSTSSAATAEYSMCHMPVRSAAVDVDATKLTASTTAAAPRENPEPKLSKINSSRLRSQVLSREHTTIRVWITRSRSAAATVPGAPQG
jgi:hypothetical protein